MARIKGIHTFCEKGGLFHTVIIILLLLTLLLKTTKKIAKKTQNNCKKWVKTAKKSRKIFYRIFFRGFENQGKKHTFKWQLLKKFTSLGSNLWLSRKFTSLNLWLFKRSQVWAQTCDLSKGHKFVLKFVNIWKLLRKFGPKLANFCKVHRFKFVRFWMFTSLS